MNRMKKLLAGLLSLALAMSLAVPAFADGAAGGEKNTYDAATDSLDGEIGNEGPIEANKIKIILPTVAASTYDMILDPHSLIKRSNNARYTAQKYAFTYGGEDSAKEGANRLFFRTSETKDGSGTVTAINWTKDSAEATITNKGMDDITVTLTVEVDPKTNDFDFVDSEADLTSTTDAQMYLAVVSGDKSKAVAAPAEDAETTLGDPTVAVTDKGTDNYLDSATFAWTADATDEIKAEVNDSLDNVTLTISINASDTTPTYTVGATGAGEKVIVDNSTATLPAGSGDESLSIDIYDGAGSKKIALVTLNLKSGNLSAGGDATAKISKGVASQPKSSAVLKVDVAGSPDAFEETHDSTKGYIWTDVADFDPDSFKKMSFNLTGNINTADAWDTLSGTGNKIGIKVIWKADQKVASESDDSGNSGNQTPAVTNAAPKAKVTTASAATGDTVVIEYDLGSGSSAKAKVNRVLFTRSGNEQAFTPINIDTGTSTITFAPAGLQFSQGGSWKVEFTDNDGNNAVTALVDSIKAVSADWVEAS